MCAVAFRANRILDLVPSYLAFLVVLFLLPVVQVRPLSPKHRMPPRHLEDRIAAFVSQMDE